MKARELLHGLARVSALTSLVVDRCQNVVVVRCWLHAVITVTCSADRAGSEAIGSALDGRPVQAIADDVGAACFPRRSNRVCHLYRSDS
jgi:hypothetical protein